MPSHRTLRIAEAIREVVAQAVLFELADPRVRGVTILRAEVSGDLRSATVYASVMGSEAEQKLAIRGLHHATGFLQAKVAARLQTRFTPSLSFKLDDSVKKSIAISKLIDEAVASDRKPAPADEAGQAQSESETEPEDEFAPENEPEPTSGEDADNP